ncbi:MAG: hypothetical protein ABIQ31_09580 [Ferruginibacter sp.]
MKQLLVIVILLSVLIGCNDTSSTSGVKTTDSSNMAAATTVTAEKYDYPYTLENPYQDWQPGDQKHAVTVLKSLKAYENGDIEASVASFGDTVDIKFDGFFARVSKDSLKKIFTTSRGELTSQKIEMHDWESVISKDKKREYVTMWYKETNTTKSGKIDSVSVVDDLRIVNGKIVELDQKIQHFPAAMAKKK